MPRLTVWFAIAAALLGALWLLNPQQLPVVLYKVTLVALAVPMTYWVDRPLFPYARPHEFVEAPFRFTHGARLAGLRPVSLAASMVMLRRAVIFLAIVIGLTLGL